MRGVKENRMAAGEYKGRKARRPENTETGKCKGLAVRKSEARQREGEQAPWRTAAGKRIDLMAWQPKSGRAGRYDKWRMHGACGAAAGEKGRQSAGDGEWLAAYGGCYMEGVIWQRLYGRRHMEDTLWQQAYIHFSIYKRLNNGIVKAYLDLSNLIPPTCV